MSVNPGKLVKLFALVVGVILADILVLSPGFLGLGIGGSALGTAIAVSMLLASALGLVYGIYAWLVKKPVLVPADQLKTPADYELALKQYRGIKALESDMSLALHQLERMKKKQETLMSVLNQRFEPGGLTFRKFASTAQEVETLFRLNIRSVLNRLRAFDEAEFESLKKRKAAPFAPRIAQEKANVYNEYMTFVASSLNANEEILLKLDKLLLEISRLDSFEPGDIEQMPGMQEIDALIKQTKHYKR